MTIAAITMTITAVLFALGWQRDARILLRRERDALRAKQYWRGGVEFWKEASHSWRSRAVDAEAKLDKINRQRLKALFRANAARAAKRETA